MLLSKIHVFALLLTILSFGVHGKVYTVCELVEALNEDHSIPHNEIYQHLCIIGDLIHTNKSSSGFLGLYRIGSEWWCGQDEPGGSCNVKCDDLVDDDISDDVLCAKKILSGHGLAGWGATDYSCKRSHEQKVKDCLQTIDEFENDAEWIFPEKSTTTTTRSTTTTTITPSTTTMMMPVDPLNLKNEEENSVFNATFFIILFALMTIVIVSVVIYLRFQKIESFFRKTFTDNIQLI